MQKMIVGMFILLLSACAPPPEQKKINPNIIGTLNPMTALFIDLNKELSSSQTTTISKESNTILIILHGDDTFDVNSWQVKPGLYSEITRIAYVMGQHPKAKIRVEGHTDSSGATNHNLKLSQKRAESIKTFLVDREVADSRIGVQALGETQPRAGNNTPEGRRLNRRIEIRLYY